MRDKKGVHNSYQSPDSINAIDWKRKAEHADVFAYYKGLIQLRKNHPAFRMGDADLYVAFGIPSCGWAVTCRPTV